MTKRRQQKQQPPDEPLFNEDADLREMLERFANLETFRRDFDSYDDRGEE